MKLRLPPLAQPGREPFRRPAAGGGDRARDPFQRPRADHGRADRGARTRGDAKVGALIPRAGASQGIGIILISHDIHDVFDLADRLAVMKNGRLVGVVPTADVTKDEVLAMIIAGKLPQTRRAA